MLQFDVDTTNLADLKLAPGQIADPIGAGMFGAIASNVLSHSHFEAEHAQMGLTGLRFPGGSLAENDTAADGSWLYDPVAYLTGFHPSHAMGDKASLDEMFDMAAAKGVTLSLTVPVERFFSDPASGGAYMTALLQRIDAMPGQPPVTLDIGNEAYADPAAYGSVVAAMLGAVRDARAAGMEGVSAGVQSMKDGWGTLANNEALVQAIRDVEPALLAEIDAVRIHALDLPMYNATRFEDVRARLPEVLLDAVAAEGGAAELHVSAWAVRGDDALPEGWDGEGSAALAASGAVLSLFSGLVEMGAVRADAWGVAASSANRTALTFADEGGARVMSPHAVTLKLMAESVQGLSLVDDGRLDTGASGPMVQTYVGEGRAVVFLFAGDIEGATEVTVDLQGLGALINDAWADRVALVDPAGAHAGHAHAVREAVAFDAAGSASWTFSEDYETVRIEIELNERPVASVANQIAAPAEWTALSTVLSAADGNADEIAYYEVYDAEGGHNWYADGATVDASSGYVTQDLAGIWFQGDAAASQQTLWVRLHDGVEWGEWDSFELVTNTPAVAAVENQSVQAAEWTLLADVLSLTDADGDAPAYLEVWDSDGQANWWADGGMVDASAGHSTADIANIWFQGDPAGSQQTLWVRAHDGTEWGEWDPFELITL